VPDSKGAVKLSEFEPFSRMEIIHLKFCHMLSVANSCSEILVIHTLLHETSIFLCKHDSNYHEHWAVSAYFLKI